MLQIADPERLRAARSAANTRGMFFAFREEAADWQPVGALYDNPTAISDIVDDVRGRMGGIESRVAASLFYQGFASRLVSPPMSAIMDSHCLPTMEQDSVSWTIPTTEMLALRVDATRGFTGEPGELLERFLAEVFDYHLEPLARALRKTVSVAPGLLRGNAAAAVISAIRLCGRDDSWRQIANTALAHQQLRGTGTLHPAPAGFTRRSCCLFYRTPRGGLCGDCPL